MLLAETARLAPEGQVGGVTGGVLSFTSIAMMTYPAIYGGVLAYTDSYSMGFVLGAAPSLLAFAVFVNPPVPGSWLDLLGMLGRRFATARAAGAAAAVGALGAAVGVAMSAFTG